MTRRNSLSLTAAAVFATLAAACSTQPTTSTTPKPSAARPKREGATLKVLEGLPTEIAKRLAARQQMLRSHLPGSPGAGLGLRYVLVPGTRWDPGAQIRVAFQGGTEELHRQIESAAAAWTSAANIGFDFGYVSGQGYRKFPAPAGEAGRPARIRISFLRDEKNNMSFWSCIGRESENGVCAASPAPSMNFGGLEDLTSEGRVPIILHEFGHALGFAHEHQNPEGACDGEFRWDDDPGYVRTMDPWGTVINDSTGRRPGLYSMLNGYPNGWDKEKVDANLRQLPTSSAYETSTFDNLSIMKYSFGAWMFRLGTSSKCYSEPNDQLSESDRVGALRLYPRTPESMMKEMSRTEAEVTGLMTKRAAPAELRDDLRRRLEALRAFRAGR